MFYCHILRCELIFEHCLTLHCSLNCVLLPYFEMWTDLWTLSYFKLFFEQTYWLSKLQPFSELWLIDLVISTVLWAVYYGVQSCFTLLTGLCSNDILWTFLWNMNWTLNTDFEYFFEIWIYELRTDLPWAFLWDVNLFLNTDLP